MSCLKKMKQERNFNSIKVRLEPIISYRHRKRNANFNSIKVRLELKMKVYSRNV